METKASIIKREPLLLTALVVYLLADLLTGTGTNSTLGAVVAAVPVALMRFLMTSPATAERFRAMLKTLGEDPDKIANKGALDAE